MRLKAKGLYFGINFQLINSAYKYNKCTMGAQWWTIELCAKLYLYKTFLNTELNRHSEI